MHSRHAWPKDLKKPASRITAASRSHTPLAQRLLFIEAIRPTPRTQPLRLRIASVIDGGFSSVSLDPLFHQESLP